ncbi:MAG TPA: phage tail protein [Stellaceae bacterium]|nr:phage tail protein [Stellaceae bacterium]
MAGIFRTNRSFLQNLAWQNQALNALQYNTSQPGSVVPWIDGTLRVPVNLIALGNYLGPGGGAKGKGVGPLPLGGTNTVGGKGGGGGGKKGGKKGPQDYFIDVIFALGEGPLSNNNGNNLIFTSASVANFSAVGLNFYSGADNQPGDPVFASLGQTVNYSGTCINSGTPMDIGMTPVIPNVSEELSGPNFQTGGPNFPVDANPGNVVTRFLTDPEVGCGFPAANVDNLFAGSGLTYGDYCQAAQLVVSVSLDAQQKAGEWLDGLAKLTNTAIVWSGELLRFIPYGDVALAANGATWTPNLTPVASLTDDDFIPWTEHQEGSGPEPGADDPIIVTRANPADAVNWLTIEYKDRSNFYNSNIIAVFDQGSIDLYGRRTGDNLNGKAFVNATSAQISAQLLLQRSQYIRNTYKFQLGWKYGLLEQMDIVLLTGRAGDSYLQQQPVRITSIEENDNGNLTVEAEEIQVGRSAPPLPPPQLALDGSVSFGSTVSAVIPSRTMPGLTTTKDNDYVILLIAMQSEGILVAPEVTSIDDNVGGLDWQRRMGPISAPGPLLVAFGANFIDAEIWYAPAPTAMANLEITINTNAEQVTWLNASAFGVSGNPVWDSNPSLPKIAQNLTNTGEAPVSNSVSSSGSTGLGLVFEISYAIQGLTGCSFENSANAAAFDGGPWDASGGLNLPIVSTQQIQPFIGLTIITGIYGRFFNNSAISLRPFTTIDTDICGTGYSWWLISGDVLVPG